MGIFKRHGVNCDCCRPYEEEKNKPSKKNKPEFEGGEFILSKNREKEMRNMGFPSDEIMFPKGGEMGNPIKTLNKKIDNIIKVCNKIKEARNLNATKFPEGGLVASCENEGIIPKNISDAVLNGAVLIDKIDSKFQEELKQAIRDKKDNFLKNNPYFTCEDASLQDIKFLMEILKLTKEV